MNKIYLILFLTLTINTRDYKICTEDTKQIVDSIFRLVQSFEKDPLAPSKEELENILKGVEKLSKECFNYNLKLTVYENCVDDVYPIFIDIKKALNDIKNGDKAKISMDFINIVLRLVNGLSTCMKDFNNLY